MRIVSWNMNQLDRVNTHHETWTYLLETLDPDIALLQEAIVPEEVAAQYRGLATPGLPNKPWGSAILSRVGDLELAWEDNSRGAVLVARCEIPALGSVSIGCVHARIIDGRVISALRQTFDALRTHLGDRFIVGGDLNTARAADRAWPQYGHGDFWRDVEVWGLKEPMPFDGGERQSYWREWLRDEQPTVGNSLQDDHVFVDAETFEKVSGCLVWDTRRVRELSDHGPIVVDLALPSADR